jgi:hypothetical protein
MGQYKFRRPLVRCRQSRKQPRDPLRDISADRWDIGQGGMRV